MVRRKGEEIFEEEEDFGETFIIIRLKLRSYIVEMEGTNLSTCHEYLKEIRFC